MTVTTPLPLIVRRLLADPRVAETSLGDGPARAQTGLAVRGFIDGMRSFETDARRTCARVRALPEGQQRFAWEGVGLMAQVHDLLPPLLELAPAERPLLLIGAGWTAALVERAVPSSRNTWANDRWWQLDGYGFCAGLMHRLGPPRAVPPSPKLVGDLAIELAIDQGLGRSLYFRHGGTATSIAADIDAHSSRRGAGLWFGVGLASVVTDGLDEHSRALLRIHGGPALRHGETLAELLLARLGMRPFTATLRRLEQRLAEVTAPPLELLRADAAALTGA
jgi:hypothetical protein